MDRRLNRTLHTLHKLHKLQSYVLIGCVWASGLPVSGIAASGDLPDADPADMDGAAEKSETANYNAAIASEYAHDGEVALAATDDEALWLEESDGRVLVLHRARRQGKPRGSIIVLSGVGLGSNGLSHAANLRINLTLHGWDTYFVRLAASTAVNAENRVEAAVSLVKGQTGEGLVILIAEGSASLGLSAEVTDLGVDGFVLLNLAATIANKKLLKGMTTPTVVLQEEPASWEKKFPLADTVEMQLLPRSYPRQENGRLLRRIRGWFKRRYG